MNVLNVEEVPVGQIDARDRLREVDADAVKVLAGSMEQDGRRRLIQPITVRPKSSGFRLVTGAHRLAAAVLLGWETIPGIVEKTMTDDDARIREIDENLHRKELSPYDEAEFLTMRWRLWVKKNSKGNRFPTVLDLSERHENAQFYAETAGLAGLNQETIRRAVRRRRNLNDVWADLKGTDAAEKGVLLDRLRGQKANIKEIVSDAKSLYGGSIEKSLTAFKGASALRVSASDALRALNKAWKNCPREKREDFVGRNQTEIVEILRLRGVL
jgi:ParB family chromosome partitioning protein